MAYSPPPFLETHYVEIQYLRRAASAVTQRRESRGGSSGIHLKIPSQSHWQEVRLCSKQPFADVVLSPLHSVTLRRKFTYVKSVKLLTIH